MILLSPPGRSSALEADESDAVPEVAATDSVSAVEVSVVSVDAAATEDVEAADDDVDVAVEPPHPASPAAMAHVVRIANTLRFIFEFLPSSVSATFVFCLPRHLYLPVCAVPDRKIYTCHQTLSA